MERLFSFWLDFDVENSKKVLKLSNLTRLDKKNSATTVFILVRF